MVLRHERATVEFRQADYVRHGDEKIDAGDDDRGERKLFRLVDFFGDFLALCVFAWQSVLVETRSRARRASWQIVNQNPADFAFPVQVEVSIE